MKTTKALLVLTCCLLPVAGFGAVWQVEKDGSGDFTVIQDAVDAAQSGDTILIGPGRFTETHGFDYYGTDILVCVSVDKSLVIQGAGRDNTFIEPNETSRNQNDPGGLASISSGLELILTDLSIVNCPGNGLVFDQASGGRLEMERVSIENVHNGIILKGTLGTSLSDCLIHPSNYINGMVAFGVQGMMVNGCTFKWAGLNIQYSSSQNNTITNCLFDECGLALVYCGSTWVSDCQFNNCELNGIHVWGTQDVHITGVEVVGAADGGIVLTGNEGLEIRDSLFQGNGASVYLGTPLPDMVFRDNHILSTPGGWAVRCLWQYHGPDTVIDLTNNYWGTDDPEEVSQSIYDGFDDPSVHLFVDFEPMAGGPVGTTSMTLDSVKALFR